MLFVSLLHHYFWWHYTQALVLYIRVSKNLWWFLVQFFSIPLLLMSLFSPFKRVVEQRRKAWDLEDLAGVLLVNAMSRIIGALVRLTIICIGIVTLVSFTLLSVVGYALWLLAPFLVVGGVGYGIWLIW